MDLRRHTCSGRLPGATLGGDHGAADADGLTAPRTTVHRSSSRAMRFDEEKRALVWMPLEGARVKRFLL
jgi:hypothetical protein